MSAEILNPPQPTAEEVAAKLEEYRAHMASGETEKALKAWRDYWGMCGEQIERKLERRL